MNTVAINGLTWFVCRVLPGSPVLVDRTGTPRLAVTDPATRTISISSAVVPPMLDDVLLHEVAHAITMSHGLLPSLHRSIPPDSVVHAEEWAVGLLEKYGLQAIILTGQILNRPVCVDNYCAVVAQERR